MRTGSNAVLTEDMLDMVEDQWEAIKYQRPGVDGLADGFYDKLFERGPEFRRLFQIDMAEQHRKLGSALDEVIKLARDKDDIHFRRELVELASRHVDYGVTSREQYLDFLSILLESILDAEPLMSSPKMRDAWETLLSKIALIIFEVVPGEGEKPTTNA